MVPFSSLLGVGIRLMTVETRVVEVTDMFSSPGQDLFSSSLSFLSMTTLSPHPDVIAFLVLCPMLTRDTISVDGARTCVLFWSSD